MTKLYDKTFINTKTIVILQKKVISIKYEWVVCKDINEVIVAFILSHKRAVMFIIKTYS